MAFLPLLTAALPGIIGGIGSLIGGSSAKKAQKRQQKGFDQAINTVSGIGQPFIDAGQSGLNTLMEFVNNPAQFQDTQAFKDIRNQQRAGAGAGFNSGDLLARMQGRFHNDFRASRLNEILGLVNTGQNAAANTMNTLANLQTGRGAAGAAGALAQGDARRNALNSIGFLGQTGLQHLGRPPSDPNPFSIFG